MKKITAMLLAGAMMLSLAACGGNGGNGSNTSNPGNSGGGSSAGGSNASSSTNQPSGADYSSLDKVTLTGADADILRQMKANEISLVVCQTAPVVSFVPEVAVFDLPMVFAKYDGATIDKVLNGDSEFNTQMGEAFNNSGFELLGILQNATYRLTTANKELKTLADFNSLQIRTMENPNHMAFWTAIGAQPVPMAWNEVYFALQSGNIGAHENAADTCLGANMNEVQKYLAFTNHILYANMMIMNQDAYNSLDPLYQQALNQAVAEAMTEIAEQLATIDSDSKAELENRGMTMIEYGPEFYDEMLAVSGVTDLYKNIDEQVGGLGTVLQDALANA